MAKTFVKNFEIDSLNLILEIQQKTIGDVSCVIWDAAIVLSKYLGILCNRNQDFLKNKQVIELGAGLGCSGLVASCFGAKVLMTDLPEVLDNLRNNIDHNKAVWEPRGGSAAAKALRWGSQDIAGFLPPDLLIAADCIYYQESVEPFIETLVSLCGDHTEIILCQEERDTPKQVAAWKLFLELFDKHFDYVIVPLEDQHKLYSCEEILILRAKKKSIDKANE